VPVQRCTFPLPIPLLPLWAVQPVQSLSACITVHFNFTYTSTPPKGRTACTGPQCLYNGALYLYLYLYSPYGPYSLYRASVSVQRCTLPFIINFHQRNHRSTVQWVLKFLYVIRDLVCNNNNSIANCIFYVTKNSNGRFHWPRFVKLTSADYRLLGCGFESHREHVYFSVVDVVCCQVEVCAMNWSLVQMSPTECGASLCVILKPRELGFPHFEGGWGVSERIKKIITLEMAYN